MYNEMINFYDYIKNNEITPNRSWKTPWENRLSPNKIVDHEMNQVFKSIQNLKDY